MIRHLQMKCPNARGFRTTYAGPTKRPWVSDDQGRCFRPETLQTESVESTPSRADRSYRNKRLLLGIFWVIQRKRSVMSRNFGLSRKMPEVPHSSWPLWVVHWLRSA